MPLHHLDKIEAKEIVKKFLNENKISCNDFLIKADGTKKFSAFSAPKRVTAYYADTNNINLKKFVAKLAELKKGKRKKLRIAYLGDSMIEDDFISLTLRSLMQQQFGGYGVGYLPMSSALTGSRTTATVHSSDTWVEYNFRNNPAKNTLFISGRNFITNGTAFAEIKEEIIGLFTEEELLEDGDLVSKYFYKINKILV